MPSFVASAPTVFVLSMMLSKRGAFIFCHTLTRSRSAPGIRPSSISTTSSRAPSVEYTVAISRPMMPPPTTSIRFGRWRSSSAPVEVTTRGSSFGRKGSFTASEPAAMMACLKRIVCVPPLAELDLQVERVGEFARALHHGDLAHLGHRRQPAGQLADDLLLVCLQLGQVDHRFGKGHAESTEVLDLVHHRGHVQQRLATECSRRSGTRRRASA